MVGRIEVGLGKHGGVEADTTCRTWQRPGIGDRRLRRPARRRGGGPAAAAAGRAPPPAGRRPADPHGVRAGGDRGGRAPDREPPPAGGAAQSGGGAHPRQDPRLLARRGGPGTRRVHLSHLPGGAKSRRLTSQPGKQPPIPKSPIPRLPARGSQIPSPGPPGQIQSP